MTHGRRAGSTVLATAILLAAACGGDDDATAPTTTDPRPFAQVVSALAADEMQGRDNQTEGSVLAQDHLIGQLSQFAEPLRTDVGGEDAYRHPFEAGTNILAVIPGGALADEYVVLGAHYDHLGDECLAEVRDSLCNGATDNAAGVAAVLEVGRALATADAPIERSVVLAFWDAEEDGLLGSQAYVAAPAVPVERTVAYLNWDIQGANLTPAVADMTFMIGAETGGPDLVAAAESATSAADLRTLPLSLVFGQGRGDHVSFVAAGVPTVFFTDATGACYHTPKDDVSVVDLDKLGQQIANAEALTRQLAGDGPKPSFVGGAPVATFADARSLLEIVRQGEDDLALLPGYESILTTFLQDLQGIVDAGPAAFDEAAIGTILGGAVSLIEALTVGDCDGFVE